MFEPRLEADLAPQVLAELQAANVQLIYARRPAQGAEVLWIMGLDGQFRRIQ